MKICVERFDWREHQPDLVVLVGDPYQDFIGPVQEALQNKLNGFAEGFASGALSREISFSMHCPHSGRTTDMVYFNTSTEKGFTHVETLKTFAARALRMAAETGRKKVAFLLKGPAGEGLIEQLVEGALVGTFKFTDYLKDPTDRFADVELILCPPTPIPPEPVKVEAETVAEESESGQKATVALTAEELAEAEAAAEEASEGDEEAAQESEDDSEEESDSEEEGDSEEENAESEDEDEEAAEEQSAEASEEESEEEEAGDEPEEEEEAPAPGWSDEEKAAFRQQDESLVYVGQAFGDGVNLARSLIAHPASVCTPAYLSKRAEKMSKEHGFAFQSFGPSELKKHNFIGHLAVGGGSSNTPRMFEMSYHPDEESAVHLVLLGKGVTFDSGGISIKPGDKMHLMIGDMSGAAAVLGAMDVIGRLKPKIKVTAVVVSAENAPDGKSYRPGDILRYKNGTSVHVENTDAEGRLLLADGLIRAGELGATHIVDVATLTGSCARALGPSFTGVMGANRKLVNAITRAGGNHGESYWRLPLPIEYRQMLKTPHADINNLGGPEAGATTAALFLKEFVPPRTAWVHLDIAGTFWKKKAWKYYSEGPSGTAVKTLADLALRWQEHLG